MVPEPAREGIVVAAGVTGANGAYHFDNLLPGSYVIQFSGAPPGHNWTSAGATGSTVANDSNPKSSGPTPVFVLEAACPSRTMRSVVVSKWDDHLFGEAQRWLGMQRVTEVHDERRDADVMEMDQALDPLL